MASCPVDDYWPDRFGADDFLRRVARRADVGPVSAERAARAVFAALWRAVGADEFNDMRSQLPKEFDPPFDGAPLDAPSPALDAPEAPGAMSCGTFRQRVAQRPGLDRRAAARAAAAALQKLAIRISVDESEDLERRLPPELRPTIKRGRAHGRNHAQPLSLNASLVEIARREGVDRGGAIERARTALATLREPVGEKGRDTTAKLSTDYAQRWRAG